MSTQAMAMAPRTISFKPTFLDELARLPANHQAQVLAKVRMLATDPQPDAKARKRLRGVENGLHRLRSGDYRVIYTFDDASVSLFSVRIRSDDTYDALPDADELTHGSFAEPERPGPTEEDFARWIARSAVRRSLPEPITAALLDALGVPSRYHARLLQITTQEDLLECPGVPDDHLLAIDTHMFDRPLSAVAEERTLVAPAGVEDLLRYTRGDLVGFLLQLDPEQRKYVSWALEASGPTLVKGGPGTGKSTVALYRVREMIGALRRAGVTQPSILFTTYTNALVTFSKQLLEPLLGDDTACVEIRTADSLVASVLGRAGQGSRRPSASERSAIQKSAFESVSFAGNALQRNAQAAALTRLGHRYAFEEIETVIQGRGLAELEDYLAANRSGRRMPLDQTARRAIWALHRSYERELEKANVQTWQQARARAAGLVRSGEVSVRYDGVIVDEAQDLDASAIRLLVAASAAPNRLFLTADVNQSIYAAGFSWRDVHESLRFVGRTGILRVNHRSTRQIAEAAHDWLSRGLPDDLVPEAQEHAHEGPLPAVRTVDDVEAEADLLARYLRGAARELRLTIGSGAVLVPSSAVGVRLAAALAARDIPVRFTDSRRFKLDDNVVQVMPFQAAKGLEFPIVALAGSIGASAVGDAADFHNLDDDDARIRLRRTVYVAMTRAMRALLVVTPAGTMQSPFDGFEPRLWNTGE